MERTKGMSKGVKKGVEAQTGKGWEKSEGMEQ